jgi:tetratricopeptide (TPR) repeat protein
MLRQVRMWLGPFRVKLLVVSLTLTGIASLLLVAFAGDESWSLPAQTFLALAFLTMATATIGTRMPRESRRRLFFTVGPALGLAALSLALPGNLFGVVMGAAFGWLLAVQFFMRDRVRIEYKTAIRHIRKQEYKQALEVISELVKKEPQQTDHLMFRARLNQLAGHLNAAIKDYEKVANLQPNLPDGYNGLSEIYLQKGDYEQARQFALQAFQRQSNFWVVPYNLAMIEDRLCQSAAVIEHLQPVLQRGLPDSRHRLLSYLWLARAQYRLGDHEAAKRSLENLRRESRGMREWRIILNSEQSTALRHEFEPDIRLATQVIENGIMLDEVFKGEHL